MRPEEQGSLQGWVAAETVIPVPVGVPVPVSVSVAVHIALSFARVDAPTNPSLRSSRQE